MRSLDNNWDLFKRIDNGWFAGSFEKSLFQGKPVFSTHKENANKQNHHSDFKLDSSIETHTNPTTLINKLSKSGQLSIYNHASSQNGKRLKHVSSIIINSYSQLNPVLGSIISLINFDSIVGVINNFGSSRQKKLYLNQFNTGKLIPFLIPTSLFETLESKKTTLEGRIESQIINEKEILGIKISFKDLILLGCAQSNCFHINVEIKDFNNAYSNKTNLGTALCVIHKKINGLEFKKGHKAYDYLNYYSCSAENIFIKLNSVVNEENGLGKGLEYTYRNYSKACQIWPLAISIPTHNNLTLTSWYFAHLQKQNGRQLLNYRVVSEKISNQYSQALKFTLLNTMLLNDSDTNSELIFLPILFKNSIINGTTNHLSLLRDILGSNSHNIKEESKLRTFYKVAQITTELDGMNYEINQLPLIKKAALSCHPFYNEEVEAIVNADEKQGLYNFDRLAFGHIGYMFSNLCKCWVYSIKTSSIFRLIFPKNKYKNLIIRLTASFAFITDISLIRWTLKSKVNTSFASYIGESLQNLTYAIILLEYYNTNIENDSIKNITKGSLKNSLYEVQQSIKENINLAFDKPTSILLKLLLFPFGRPLHVSKFKHQMDNEIDEICKQNNQSPSKYSPFLEKLFKAKIDLSNSQAAEIAVTNATGTAITSDNYELLINRCLAAGILSIEESEKLRSAYQQILDIQLTNHFGSIYEK